MPTNRPNIFFFSDNLAWEAPRQNRKNYDPTVHTGKNLKGVNANGTESCRGRCVLCT